MSGRSLNRKVNRIRLLLTKLPTVQPINQKPTTRDQGVCPTGSLQPLIDHLHRPIVLDHTSGQNGPSVFFVGAQLFPVNLVPLGK